MLTRRKSRSKSGDGLTTLKGPKKNFVEDSDDDYKRLPEKEFKLTSKQTFKLARSVSSVTKDD